MKLHLGCGSKRWPGFINIDIPGSGADVECDIRRLPYDDNSVEQIHAIHVFEHLYYQEAVKVLSEWLRVLQPGGMLALELPCWDKVADLIKQGETRPQLVRWPLHGDPGTHRGEADVHKWCWSVDELAGALSRAGYQRARVMEPQFHVAVRDMRLEAYK